MGFDERSWLHLIVGLVLGAVGVLSILSHFNALPFSIAFLKSTIVGILTYIVAFGALIIIIEAFMETLHEAHGVITLLIGLVLMAIGVLGILNISIPILSSILTPIVYYFIFALQGLVLIIGAFLLE